MSAVLDGGLRRACSVRRSWSRPRIIVKGYSDVGDGFSAGRDRRARDRAALRHARSGARRAEPAGAPPRAGRSGLRAPARARDRLLPDPPRRPAVHALSRSGEQVVQVGTLELITRGGVRRRRLPARRRLAGRRSSTSSRGWSRSRGREPRLRARRCGAVRHRRRTCCSTATWCASCFGVVLISQAAVLTLVASGLSRGAAPIYPLSGAPSPTRSVRRWR